MVLLDTNFVEHLAGRFNLLPRASKLGSDSCFALAYDLTLVTHDVGEFSRVGGLRIEDWQVA